MPRRLYCFLSRRIAWVSRWKMNQLADQTSSLLVVNRKSRSGTEALDDVIARLEEQGPVTILAVKIICTGHIRSIDIDVANDVYFVNAIGIGLGPSMSRQMHAQSKKSFGGSV